MNPQNKTKLRCRVLIFDTQYVIGEALGKLLEGNNSLQVVDVINNLERLYDQTSRLKPDLILLSISYFNSGDITATAKLLEKAPETKVLLLISRYEETKNRLAIEHGAAGIVYREQDCKTLYKAIEHILDGAVWFDKKLISQIINSENHSNGKPKSEVQRKIESLTEREREIIELIAKGYKNKSIAKTLFISEATVRHHLTTIFNKLQVTDRMNLLIFGYQHQLIKPEANDSILFK